MAPEKDLNFPPAGNKVADQPVTTGSGKDVDKVAPKVETVSLPQSDRQPTKEQIATSAESTMPTDEEIPPVLSGHSGSAAKVYPGEPDPLISTRKRDTMDDDEVIDTLNALLESSRDGEYGYRQCAERAQSVEIKTVMLRHADSCAAGARDLVDAIRQLGGKAEAGGTVTGAMHRGWVSVRSTLAGHSDHAMLDECERGEDAALARYRKAIKEPLPESVRSLVEQHMQGAQRNHDQIKALRDAGRTD